MHVPTCLLLSKDRSPEPWRYKMVDGGRRVQRRIDEWELNGVEERYMKGWKISKIIHMFTRPLKCPGGGPHKHEIEMDQQQNT